MPLPSMPAVAPSHRPTHSPYIPRKLRPLLPKPPSTFDFGQLPVKQGIRLPLIAPTSNMLSSIRSTRSLSQPQDERTCPQTSLSAFVLLSTSNSSKLANTSPRLQVDRALARSPKQPSRVITVHPAVDEEQCSVLPSRQTGHCSFTPLYPSPSPSPLSTLLPSLAPPPPFETASPLPPPTEGLAFLSDTAQTTINSWHAQWALGIDPNATYLRTSPSTYFYPNLYPISSSLDSALGDMFDHHPAPLSPASQYSSSPTTNEQSFSDSQSPPDSKSTESRSQMALYELELSSSYQDSSGSTVPRPESPFSSTSTCTLATPPVILSEIDPAVALWDMVAPEVPYPIHGLSPLLNELDEYDKSPPCLALPCMQAAAAPAISDPVVTENQSRPQDGLVPNINIISGQGQVSPGWSPCQRAVEPNQANNPAIFNQSGGGDKISLSKKRPREVITPNALSSFSPGTHETPTRLESPPLIEYQILEENFYYGPKGSFRRRVPGIEGGKRKTPEDYQQGDTSRKPRKRRKLEIEAPETIVRRMELEGRRMHQAFDAADKSQSGS